MLQDPGNLSIVELPITLRYARSSYDSKISRLLWKAHLAELFFCLQRDGISRRVAAPHKSGVVGVCFMPSMGCWQVNTLAKWGIRHRTLARRSTQVEAEAIAKEFLPKLEDAAAESVASFEVALSAARENLTLKVRVYIRA